jgi:hypothetical protein
VLTEAESGDTVDVALVFLANAAGRSPVSRDCLLAGVSSCSLRVEREMHYRREITHVYVPEVPRRMGQVRRVRRVRRVRQVGRAWNAWADGGAYAWPTDDHLSDFNRLSGGTDRIAMEVGHSSGTCRMCDASGARARAGARASGKSW